MPPLNMDNEGFQADEDHKGHNIIETVGSNAFSPKNNMSAVDLNRAVSITREDEQVTFSWDKLTVKTKATSGRSLFHKADPRPSKTLVNNSKLLLIRPLNSLIAIIIFLS